MPQLLAGILLVVLFDASIARACVARGCTEGTVLPEDLSYTPGLDLEPDRPGEVPENQVAIVWRKPFTWVGKNSKAPPRLFVRDEGARREITFSTTEVPGNPFPLDGPQLFVIEPDEALVAGSELVFEWEEFCADSWSGQEQPRIETRIVRVVPAAPVPRKLGKLKQAGDVQRGSLDVGSCGDSVETKYADFDLELSPEAEPFGDLLRFELLVDGEPHEFYDAQAQSDARRPIGGGLLGRGRERVYDKCKGDSGEHRVQLRAALPDGTELATQELTVDLSCGGCSLTPAARGGSVLWLGVLAGAVMRLRRRRRP